MRAGHGGVWSRARLIDRQAQRLYVKYGRLLAALVCVALVVDVVRLAVHPRLEDAISLLVGAAVAAWFFWPLLRHRRSSH